MLAEPLLDISVNVPFQWIIGVVETTVDTIIKHILESRCEIATKHRPIGLILDVSLVPHPPMLQGIGKTWVETMTSRGMAVCSPKILRSGVTLCDERYGCEKQNGSTERSIINAIDTHTAQFSCRLNVIARDELRIPVGPPHFHP